MQLINYEGLKVKIVDVDGAIFEGLVTDYVYPDEDDTGLESIIIDCVNKPFEGKSIEFWSNDIKSIQVIL